MMHQLPENSPQIISRYSVVELLMNEDDLVIDYVLIYPYFENRLDVGEYIRYGIHSLPPYDGDKPEITEFIFETANEAEDFLIEELDKGKMPHRFN